MRGRYAIQDAQADLGHVSERLGRTALLWRDDDEERERAKTTPDPYWDYEHAFKTAPEQQHIESDRDFEERAVVWVRIVIIIVAVVVTACLFWNKIQAL